MQLPDGLVVPPADPAELCVGKAVWIYKLCGRSIHPVWPAALETLGRFKQVGEELILYSVHGSHAGWRHSYRLIPETPLELLFLEHEACDYIYSQFRSEETQREIFGKVGVFCTEQGIWASRRWIPGWLITAWENP